MLRAHAPLINQAASDLVRRLTCMHKAGAVQINNAMSGMTMEVIGGVAFGYANFYTPDSGVMLLFVFACHCMQIFSAAQTQTQSPCTCLLARCILSPEQISCSDFMF